MSQVIEGQNSEEQVDFSTISVRFKFGSEVYSSGTNVTLTATPQVGSSFAGWTGACTGTGSCVIPMTSAKSVTATFN